MISLVLRKPDQDFETLRSKEPRVNQHLPVSLGRLRVAPMCLDSRAQPDNQHCKGSRIQSKQEPTVPAGAPPPLSTESWLKLWQHPHCHPHLSLLAASHLEGSPGDERLCVSSSSLWFPTSAVMPMKRPMNWSRITCP